MVAFEWLAVAYFAALAVAALVLTPRRPEGLRLPGTRTPWRRRLAVSGGSVAAAALVGVVGSGDDITLRTWLPHAYLVGGYWLPALLVERPVHATRFERWLRRTDAALRPGLPGIPGWLAPIVELAYFACYPLVTVSLAIVSTSGAAADVNRFWLVVLMSGYACYGSLPWLVSRPPRLAAQTGLPARRAGKWNAFVLTWVSHQLNTFPSGHVAVTAAAAAAVMAVSLPTGVIIASIAAAVAVGASAGRYHYVIDVVLGIVVAGGAVLITLVAGFS